MRESSTTARQAVDLQICFRILFTVMDSSASARPVRHRLAILVTAATISLSFVSACGQKIADKADEGPPGYSEYRRNYQKLLEERPKPERDFCNALIENTLSSAKRKQAIDSEQNYLKKQAMQADFAKSGEAKNISSVIGSSGEFKEWLGTLTFHPDASERGYLQLSFQPACVEDIGPSQRPTDDELALQTLGKQIEITTQSQTGELYGGLAVKENSPLAVSLSQQNMHKFQIVSGKFATNANNYGVVWRVKEGSILRSGTSFLGKFEQTRDSAFNAFN